MSLPLQKFLSVIERMLVVIAFGSGFAIVVALCCFAATGYKIYHYDQSYNAVSIADTNSVVESKMGKQHSIRDGDGMFSGGPLNDSPVRKGAAYQYQYSVRTFFLPITWIIEFNARHQVIYKFRLD